MTKVTLSNVTNFENQQSAASLINANWAAIVTAIENTLSRDGTSPNSLTSDLDINGNQILNLPTPVANTDVVRLEDLNASLTAAGLKGAKGDTGSQGIPAAIYIQSATPATTGISTGSLWIKTSTTYWSIFTLVGTTWTDSGLTLLTVIPPVASVDGEIVLYSGTAGNVLKRASISGILKGTSGVLSAATANTDYPSVANTVTGAGLATGGGAINSSQVITVTAATGTQAVAGSSTTVAVTPAALATAFQTLSGSNFLFLA